MKDLMLDTLIWFGGFIAVSLSLLMLARKLTQRSRTIEQTFSAMTADAENAPTGLKPSDPFGVGLPELFPSTAIADPTKKYGREKPRTRGSIPRGPTPGSLTMALTVVACGSLAGGVMWSLTAEPRSWLGVGIGLFIAMISASLGLWLNTGVRTASRPPLNRHWADMLELLALRWSGAGPQDEMLRQVARSIEPHDAPLAAFVTNSAALPFIESPWGNQLVRYQTATWPESSTEQVQWFRETSCQIRRTLADDVRHDAGDVSKRMKYAIWLFLAPSLYLMLLTPPAIEMISFFRPRPMTTPLAPGDSSATLPPALATPENEFSDDAPPP